MISYMFSYLLDCNSCERTKKNPSQYSSPILFVMFWDSDIHWVKFINLILVCTINFYDPSCKC